MHIWTSDTLQAMLLQLRRGRAHGRRVLARAAAHYAQRAAAGAVPGRLGSGAQEWWPVWIPWLRQRRRCSVRTAIAIVCLLYASHVHKQRCRSVWHERLSDAQPLPPLLLLMVGEILHHAVEPGIGVRGGEQLTHCMASVQVQRQHPVGQPGSRALAA